MPTCVALAACYRTPAMDGQAVFGLTDGRHKYIYEGYAQPWDALFDLGRDPAEQRPIRAGAALLAWRRRASALLNINIEKKIAPRG